MPIIYSRITLFTVNKQSNTMKRFMENGILDLGSELKMIQIKNLQNRLLIYEIVYLIYKILLEISYVYYISPTYLHMGFALECNFLKSVISYIFLIILVLILPRKKTSIGTLIHIFFSTYVVPMLSFFWLADKETEYIVYAIVFFTIIRFTSSINVNYKFSNNKEKIDFSSILNIIFVSYISISIFLGIKRGGIDIRSLSFSSIYELRLEEKNLGLFAYVENWCVKSLFPIFCAYYIYNKKYIKVLLCVLTQIFMYTCFGYKAYLFSAISTVFVFMIEEIFYKYNFDYNFSCIVIFVFGLITWPFVRFKGLMGTICYHINNVFTMRMLFEPARISFGYFKYFSTHDKLYFSEGLIGKVFKLNYPYGNEPIGFVITRFLNGEDAVSNAVTGITADSYAQLGVVGMLLIAVITGLLLMTIKNCTNNLPSYFVVAALFYPMFMLNDCALFTNLLTNGWIVDVVLLFQMNKSNITNYRCKIIKTKNI